MTGFGPYGHDLLDAFEILALLGLSVWFWRLRHKRGRGDDCR